MAAIPGDLNRNYQKKKHNGYSVYYKRKKPALTRRIWSMFFHEDFHFLRYWILIEEVIKEKHGLDREDLFFLLYLSSREIFSIVHIEHYPLSKTPLHKTRVKKFEEDGYFTVIRGGGKYSQNVYKPTPKLKNLQRDIYSRALLRSGFKLHNTPQSIKKNDVDGYKYGNFRAYIEEFNNSVDLYQNTVKQREEYYE